MVLLCLCQITLDFYPLSPICSRLEHKSVHVKSLYVTRARQVMARISNGFDSPCEFYTLYILEQLSKTCWNDAVQSRVYVGDKAYMIFRHFSSFKKYFDKLRVALRIFRTLIRHAMSFKDFCSTLICTNLVVFCSTFFQHSSGDWAVLFSFDFFCTLLHRWSSDHL